MVSSIPSKQIIYRVIWYQVFLSNTNKLHTGVWLQVFLSSTNNIYRVVWFQVFLRLIIYTQVYTFK